MEELPSLFLILALILLNGTFVAAEFSIARVRKTHIDHIVESKGFGLSKRTYHSAKLLQKILDNINNYISACQVGITVASLALGALAEAKLEKLISPLLEQYTLVVNAHGVAIVLAIALITFFHVILGEIVPKNIAIISPEKVSLNLAYFLSFLHTIFKIPVRVLNACSNFCLNVMGLDIAQRNNVHSEAELKMILSSSQAEGILEEEEEQLIQNIFEFNDTVAKDIMVPRTDAICLNETMSIKNAIHEANKVTFSRFPIFDKRLDNVTGYVTIKDMLIAYESGHLEDPIKTISNEILKAPDGIYVIDLMKIMQQKKKQIAVLIDEFGGTSGLVTIEDIVEEIFGEIEDEREITRVPIVKLSNGDYLVDGLLSLRDVNEKLGSNFESDHYDTLGGLVFGLIGSEPKNGDSLMHDGLKLVVEKHDKNRVRVVRIVPVLNSDKKSEAPQYPIKNTFPA